ncbi:MAG: twin-arginine translocase subunit TatC [Muribaculaceae bacterium]|nr:twin-arginine translocase subunit TatC [Muribaculaceae bacterium]
MSTQDTEMTFWSHLEALRWVLMRVVLVYLVLAIACFCVMPYLFNNVILAPTTSDFILYRWLNGLGGDGTFFPDFSSDFSVDIINVKLASQFTTHISTSFCLAFLLIFPYLITELWYFIRPALYENERRSVVVLLAFGVPMFYMGCVLGYFVVFPFTFRFLAQYDLSSEITNMISLNSYIDNFLMLIFIMGLVFELPFVVWVLSRLGLVTADFLRSYRRQAVVGLLVLSALITPTGDPFTLAVVFVPIYLLFELSVLLARNRKPDDEEETDNTPMIPEA